MSKEVSKYEGVLLGLKICKEMFAQGQLTHDNIYEHEVHYTELRDNEKSKPLPSNIDKNISWDSIKAEDKKQTAVEFYAKEINYLFEKYESKEISQRDFITMKHNLFYPAKEIEKQQIERMYSEEEVKSAFKIGFNIGYGSPVPEIDLKQKHCDKWFKQFKNK